MHGSISRNYALTELSCNIFAVLQERELFDDNTIKLRNEKFSCRESIAPSVDRNTLTGLIFEEI